jgi:hypothetical protein
VRLQREICDRWKGNGVWELILLLHKTTTEICDSICIFKRGQVKKPVWTLSIPVHALSGLLYMAETLKQFPTGLFMGIKTEGGNIPLISLKVC